MEISVSSLLILSPVLEKNSDWFSQVLFHAVSHSVLQNTIALRK